MLNVLMLRAVREHHNQVTAVCRRDEGCTWLTRRYTLESHPPAECAKTVIGPSVACFAAFTASSTLLRYLHRHCSSCRARERDSLMHWCLSGVMRSMRCAEVIQEQNNHMREQR